MSSRQHLVAPLCLHYGESKFSLHAGSPSCLRSTFCAATPRLKIQNPCVMCKVFYWFSVCCSRVRVTTRWWTLMVAAHLLPLYLGESVFPGVFGDILSGPSLCSHSSRFATLGRGGSGDFRGVLPLCPLSLGSLSHCRAVASPSPVFWGGGRKTLLYSFIIMHSCNPNDRIGL